MNGSSFLNAFIQSSLFEKVGEALLPECEGRVLLMDDAICRYLMHNDGMNYPIVEKIESLGLNFRDGLTIKTKARVFGFVAKDTVNLEHWFVHDLTPLQTVALTQSQLVLMFMQDGCSTDVLACDIRGRKNITILRHGDKTHYLEVALYDFGFPTFHFLESIENVFLQPGEGLFFAISDDE